MKTITTKTTYKWEPAEERWVEDYKYVKEVEQIFEPIPTYDYPHPYPQYMEGMGPAQVTWTEQTYDFQNQKGTAIGTVSGADPSGH